MKPIALMLAGVMLLGTMRDVQGASPTAAPKKAVTQPEAGPSSPIYITVSKNASYIQPPVPYGDGGHMLRASLSAPGKITGAKIYQVFGNACGWMHEIKFQSTPNEKVIDWLGWSNSGENCEIVFEVRFEVPRK